MNDEKTAVINMISDGTITSSEGIALFETLCDLEGIGAYKDNVETEDLRHLPPWESEEGEGNDLGWSLLRNEFVKAIALANHDIISALQTDDMEENPFEIPARISALDLIQLLRFRVIIKRDVPSALVSGIFSLKGRDEGIAGNGGGFLLARILNNARLGRSPTWGEPILLQIFSVPRLLRLKLEADEVIDEEQDRVRIVSTVESFDDSLTTKAGKFDGCLKLKITISALGDSQFDIADENVIHDINNNLRMIGTKSIWLAPNVGVVKFLHQHFNNTQTQIELVDYQVEDGEHPYFPLSLGNKWRYQWRDAFGVHQEVIRVISRGADGAFAVSFAKHMEENV